MAHPLHIGLCPYRRLVPLFLLAAVLGCDAGAGDSKLLEVARRVFTSKEVQTDPQPASPVASTSDAESIEPASRGRIVLIESLDISTLEDDTAEAAPRSFYRYTDASGRLHLVEGIQNVPEAYRDAAARLSGNAGPRINRYEAKASAPRSRPRMVASTFNPNRLDVTLYSAPWCGACQRVKQLLDDEGVSYTEYDVDADDGAREEVRQVLGNVQIPLLEIDGAYIAGYSRSAILRRVRGG